MIVFLILKYIGLFIAWAAAALFAVVLVVLFSRIRYGADIGYDKEFGIKAVVSWIFGFVRIHFDNGKGDSALSVKLFWFKLNGREKKPKKSREKNKGKKRSGHDKAKNTEKEIFIPETYSDNITDIKREESIGDEAAHAEKEKDKRTGKDKFGKRTEDKKSEDKSDAKTKEKNRYEKEDAAADDAKNVTEKISDIIDKIKTVLEYPERNEIVRLAKSCIVKTAKGLGLRKFMLYAVIGFEDPATTGEVIAAACIIRAATGLDIRVEGDFRDERLSLECKLSGKTTLLRAGLPLLMFILKKPIRKLIFKREKDVE